MRILVVSQYFWPENFRINDLCAELVKRGHEVTVLTGKPNYPDGSTFQDYTNAPEKFNDYKGCYIVRVPMSTRGKNCSIKLMLNYFTFALSATFIGAWKLRKKQFDVIFVFEPSPVTVGLPAIFLKKLKKAPVVFWVLDLWPETLEAVGVIKSPRILNLVGKLVSFIYNRCDLVLGQSKAFDSGISRYCKDETKIKYFPSWSENMFLSQPDSVVIDMDDFDGFKVLFAGNIGNAQDFPAILKALEVLKKQEASIKLFIVGGGRALAWLKEEIQARKLSKYIVLLGQHSLDSMPSFYCSADALLMTLKESSVFTVTIPGKLQSYMAAGKPILTMLSGEGSRLVEEARCGYVANSGDFISFANNMMQMSALDEKELKLLGDKAKQYSELEFDRNKLITQLESWFTELSNQSKELKS